MTALRYSWILAFGLCLACSRTAIDIDDETGTADETATGTAGETNETEGIDEAEVTTTADEQEEEEEETTAPGNVCGDGVVGGDEACDGDDFDGQSCQSLGFLAGELSCTDACTIDATGCVNEQCGNGTIEGDEECDLNDLSGANCIDLGFGPGLPLCTVDCTLDTSTCETLGEGEPCGFMTPCANNLQCIDGTCYDGSSGDPCEGDMDCQSNDCVMDGMWGSGMCA